MNEAHWIPACSYDVPSWIKDCKFGIYTHWGVFSVPGCGPNATWYGYNMYREGSLQNLFHRINFGAPEKFGYKDFIPMFTAERFDPDEWAQLFKKSGAGFAGPVGEHHEGFSLWGTRHNSWNAVKMGPKRDIVGELAKSIKSQGLKFMVAMHHAETWYFYPHWKRQYDVSNPEFSELYGENHNMSWADRSVEVDPNPYIANHEQLWPLMEKPSKRFLDTWLDKLKELTDNYSPDLMWFDFGLKYIQESYKNEFVRYYHESAEKLGKEVVIAYKWHSLPIGSGIEDLEQGGRTDLSYNFWVTDTTVDNGEAWGYIYNNSYKTPKALIHYLIDNVSKNGALILSIGPKADGTIPEEVQHVLLEMGKWLEVNGEAIYNTRPWFCFGEGPTKGHSSGAFSELEKVEYTAEDIRYTSKDNLLFAISLGWPSNGCVVLKRAGEYLYPQEIAHVELLGYQSRLSWRFTDAGLVVRLPEQPACDYACSIKITRKRPSTGRQ